MAFNGGSAGSLQRSVSEKTPQFFWPPLPAEYVTVFSGRSDAPEVRCDLTDRQTHRPNYSNPPVHACRGINTWTINQRDAKKGKATTINNRKAKQHNTTCPKQSFFKEKLAASGIVCMYMYVYSTQWQCTLGEFSGDCGGEGWGGEERGEGRGDPPGIGIRLWFLASWLTTRCSWD